MFFIPENKTFISFARSEISMSSKTFWCVHHSGRIYGRLYKSCMNPCCKVKLEQQKNNLWKLALGICNLCRQNCTASDVPTHDLFFEKVEVIDGPKDEDFKLPFPTSDTVQISIQRSKLDGILPKNTQLNETQIINLCKLYENVIKLLERLPHNSNKRRSLISNFSVGFSREEAAKFLKVSEKTITRSNNEKMEDSGMLSCRSGFESQRKKEEISIFEDFVENELPTQSGTKWRNLQGTIKNLYQKYLDAAVVNNTEELCMQRSYFFDYITNLRIHKVKKPTCPHCIRLLELRKKNFIIKKRKKRVREGRITRSTKSAPAQGLCSTKTNGTRN